MLVYKITNLVNGKFYIGKTTKTINERFKQHCSAKTTMLITKAINKYGVDNFTIEQIATANSDEELSNLEKQFINELSPQYNIAEGGRGGATRRGIPHDSLTKLKISAALRGRSISTSHRESVRLGALKSWRTGMLGSAEVRSKRAKSNRKIYRFSTEADDVITYDLKRFCKDHNLSYICMIAIASGKRSTPHHGYTAARRDSN